LRSKGEDTGNGEQQQRRSEAKALKKELILLICVVRNKHENQTNRHAKKIIYFIFLNVFLAEPHRAAQWRGGGQQRAPVSPERGRRGHDAAAARVREQARGVQTHACAQ